MTAAGAQRRGGRDRAPLIDTSSHVERWLPVVEQLRPKTPWSVVASAVRAAHPEGAWTRIKLVLAVRRLVVTGRADARLIRRS